MPVRSAKTLERTKTFPIGPTLTQEQLDAGEEQTIITVKYADSRAYLGRQNLFAAVRYITESGDGKTVTERQFPMGDLRLQTILLVLKSWNVRLNKDAEPAPITPATVVDLLTPDEIEQAYNEIIEMNPVWNNSADEGEA